MVNKTKGIITLYRHQKAAFAITSKRGPTPKAPKTANNDLPIGSGVATETDEVHKMLLLLAVCVSYEMLIILIRL